MNYKCTEHCKYRDKTAAHSKCIPCLDADWGDYDAAFGPNFELDPSTVPALADPAGPHPLAGDPIEAQTFGPMPENPKAIYGRSKPSLALIPGGAMVEMAGVFKLGAEKYGLANWRKDPVESMTYANAALRHLFSWLDGEAVDPESGQSHLAHAMACLGIVIDAAACGKLIDNRPITGSTADLIAAKTKPIEKESA